MTQGVEKYSETLCKVEQECNSLNLYIYIHV